jgi:hypothetical protein
MPAESSSEDIKNFLTNLKLIYEHGVSHSRNKSKMHLLFAIHNCHYAVEQILREKAKDITFSDALHRIGFKEVIEKVHESQNIPDYNYLLSLNKIRNDAEHSNIIPDVDTVRFYVKIAGNFLRWSCQTYFGIDYDSLALENMIHDVPIRNAMLEAKQAVSSNDLPKASAKMYEALAAFKFMWFGYLSDYRVHGISFSGIDFPNLLADLAFKIILAEDENTLGKLMGIGSRFRVEDGKIVGVESVYPVPTLGSQEDASIHYEDILNIILTYQDRVPASRWRQA